MYPLSVSLMVSNRPFATIAVGRKLGVPTLRVKYFSGSVVDIDLTKGETIVIGTTRYTVTIEKNYVRFKKVRGAIRFCV